VYDDGEPVHVPFVVVDNVEPVRVVPEITGTPELVGAAKEQKMEALALTDNGNLYGAIEFYKECKKNRNKNWKNNCRTSSHH
jgi:hypothetical protein